MPFPARLPAAWLANAAARVALASGVGYLAAAYTVSRFLTRPRRKVLRRSPADVGLPFEAIELTASDGVALAGWIVEPAEPRGTVALFHGMRHTREHMLERMQFLHAAGYRCVAIDHRAHGHSGGKRVSFGWYECRDVAAVAGMIEQRWPGQPRFALGSSMGAAAICFAGSACGWSAAVLEGIYAEVGLAFRRRIGLYYPAWFASLYPAVMWITQKRIKVSPEEVRPVESVRLLDEMPLLFVTGDADKLAPPEDAIRVAAAAGASAEMHIVPGAGHGNIAELGGEGYRERLLTFLEKNIRKPAA